jgi:LysM repeat protein
VDKGFHVRWLALAVILGIMLLTGCSGEDTAETDSVAAEENESAGAQTAADSPLPTATVPPVSDKIGMLLTGGDKVQVGNILPVKIELVGEQTIGEIQIEAQLPILYLQVVDAEPETEEIEVTSDLPTDKILQNEVDESGILHFSAKDLNLAQSEGRLELCMIPLRSVAVGQEEISVSSIIIRDLQGETLDVDLPGLFFITVQEEPIENTPTPEPTPMEDATPTLVATPTADATPTSGPTPTSLPISPAPLPPLSEVITEPIKPEPDSVYYRIQPKQTIYRLSKMFGTTVEAIVDANNIEDVESVRMGTVLHIPVSPPVGKTAYFVSTKETLYSIAHAFGLTVEVLADLNQIPAASYEDIKIGQWLVLLPED